MAVTHGKSPVLMTAQGDSFGNDGHNWKVTNVRWVCSSGGQVIILDKLGGREIWRSGTLSAGETDEAVFDSHWFDGMYVSQNPGGTIYVYYC